MFSVYTSKFLSQSKANLDESRSPSNDAPLFYSVADAGEDEAAGPGPSLYGSTRNWTSSFGTRYIKASQAVSSSPSYGLGVSSRGNSDDEDEGDEDGAFQTHHSGGPNAYDPDFHQTHQSDDSQSSLNPHMLQTIGLHESHRFDDDHEPPLDVAIESPGLFEDSPHASHMGMRPFVPPEFLPGQPDAGAADYDPSVRSDFVPPETHLGPDSGHRFDALWGNIYLAFVSMVFATALMVWLSTSVPRSSPLGDTVYTVLRASGWLLVSYTFIALAISLAWVHFMNNYASLSVYALVAGVPVGLVILTIYPLVMSYKSAWGGNTSQDIAMRWSSFAPLGLAIAWVTILYKGRRSLAQSLGIIKLACTVLTSNSPLLILSTGIIGVFALVSTVWIAMFARLFLQGHTLIDHGKSSWVLDPSSWALGAAFILMYLWTWGVISGIQRGAISVTVSQWYFHRHEFPQASPSTIVRAGLQYCLTTQFGTVCLSSLLALLVRLPLLLLPKRVMSLIYLVVSRVSALMLTSPLVVTNAVINGQSFMDSCSTISATLSSTDFIAAASNTRIQRSQVPYRLAKLLLVACRMMTALGLGVGAWVHAARYTNGGSLYGYIVGLLAGFIGWVILGATEGTLSMIVDALFVSFALDNHSGKGGHCVEADRQFGGI